MNVVYFTEGESIQDIEVRAQLLRIPEVLSDLRQAQALLPNIDLISVMGSQDLFTQLPNEFRAKLAQLVQEALFKRWKFTAMVKFDLILERRRFENVKDWHATLKVMMKKDPEIHIYVLGPGFDNLEYEINKITLKNPPQIYLHEVISEDPQLDWFWPTILMDAKLSA
jgi:hypothetical protein